MKAKHLTREPVNVCGTRIWFFFSSPEYPEMCWGNSWSSLTSHKITCITMVILCCANSLLQKVQLVNNFQVF